MAAVEDDPQRRKPDISRAKQFLNWEPKVSLREGLKKTVSYFAKELQKTKYSQKTSYKHPSYKNDHDIIEQLEWISSETSAVPNWDGLCQNVPFHLSNRFSIIRFEFEFHLQWQSVANFNIFSYPLFAESFGFFFRYDYRLVFLHSKCCRTL